MVTFDHQRVARSSRAAAAPIQVRRPLFSPMVQRAPTCACGGTCPRCQAKSNLTISQPNDPAEREADAVADQIMRMPDSSSSGIIKASGGGVCSKCPSELGVQTKLRIGAANDKHEREADRVADQVVNGGGYLSVKPNAVQGDIQRMSAEGEEEDEEQSVQRKPNSNADTSMPSQTESYIHSLDVGGVPLSQSESRYYETRFGRPFKDVRIHTGEAADQAAQSINARAFTLGNHIAFAKGEYDFSSGSGRKLMAHELTHTVQQSAGAESVQRGSAGIFGGKCCNPAARVEWALVGAGVWTKLEQGECTGITKDCDGMTCGGGFYHVDNGQTGNCSTPRHDDATFAPRRWTPTSQGANAHSPTAEGSAGGDTPPNYVYDSAPTAQCRNGVRTITVDFVTLNGATTSTSTELAAANSLYSTCCIRFVAGATPPQESLATTQAWLGGDTDVNASGVTCANPTAEEKSMYDAATSAHSLSSRMRVFLVQTFSGYGTAAGFSRPPYCSGGYANHVILSNAVSSTTNPLAHEFGHILLNSGAHTTAPNLMAPSGGTVLSPTDCATCFSNA